MIKMSRAGTAGGRIWAWNTNGEF